MTMSDLAGLQKAIEDGNRDAATAITQAAIAAGVPARTILDAMTAAMDVVGDRFQCNQIFVPEMLIAARAMKEATAILEPMLVAADIQPIATAVIGTVRGDLHDIGKNLVGMMWKGANIAVVDIGTNVAPERFAEAARQHGARIVGVSALLTTTMSGMREVVAAIRAAGLDDVKVIVGGAPVTPEFAARIGADAFAPDAGAAVHVALTAIA
jgi:5-methyltetrahydrofolate--homocysteine methyltransferase